MNTNTLKLFFGAVAISLLIFSPTTAVADNIDVTSVTGNWQNVQGGPEPVFSQNLNGSGTNFMQWGITTSNNGQSGYKFVGDAPPTISSIPLDQPFALGTFFHYNFPILTTGGSLSSTDLAVSLNFSINGQNLSANNVYTFLHNETPNVNLNIQNPINNDIVSFLNNTSSQQVVDIGGMDYALTLLGFSTTPGGTLVSQFSTTENKINSAQLFAEFTKVGVEVPEPSTYMLLGGMLLVIALTKKRVSAKTN